jgi:Ran GTPase-activating protein (RanGAP) involved in mRNA processing and transport
MYLDLSKNSLHGKASKTISSFFTEKNTLFYLDISNCQLDPKEISLLFKTLLNNNQNVLQDLNIASNKLDLVAVQSISTYIASYKICHLKSFGKIYIYMHTHS